MAIAAVALRSADRSCPGVKSTVLCAVGFLVVIAEARVRFEVEIFRHPRLGADGDSLVRLTIAGVYYGIHDYCRRINYQGHTRRT